MISCSFCLCNSASFLQSLDNVDFDLSENGDFHYWELEFISLSLVQLFAVSQSLQTCLITPVHVKARHPPLHLDYSSHAHKTPWIKLAKEQLVLCTVVCYSLSIKTL